MKPRPATWQGWLNGPQGLAPKRLILDSPPPEGKEGRAFETRRKTFVVKIRGGRHRAVLQPSGDQNPTFVLHLFYGEGEDSAEDHLRSIRLMPLGNYLIAPNGEAELLWHPHSNKLVGELLVGRQMINIELIQP